MPKRESIPKISVITPVKNSIATLEKTIQSLINQNYPNLEYIVIDGGSTDGTVDIIKKYEQYISYWQSELDESNVVAHIKGLEKASGEIVNFLNADDFYEPEILTKAGEAFQNEPDLDIVSFGCLILKQDNSVTGYSIIEELKNQDMVLDKNKIIKVLAPNARFFKKELFYKYGFPILRDDRNRPFISNDLEYLIRFTLSGVKNKIIDYIGYNYLTHQNSLTSSGSLESNKRLYEDKIFIAKKFLSQEKIIVPKIWQKTFKKWMIKYRAKLAVTCLKQKNFQEIKSNINLGIKENGGMKFIFYLFKTLFRN